MPIAEPVEGFRPACGTVGERILVGFGQVRHKRFSPHENNFSYPTCFLMLPLRAMAQTTRNAINGGLGVGRFAALSFSGSDHGDGREDALSWFDDLLQQNGVADAHGEVWLQCYPRVFGYSFKPVSFWYAHRADGSLRCVLAEVNNTFGERHCYLLDAPRFGVEQTAEKVFHVSPFCRAQGQYRFRFMQSACGSRMLARVDLYNDEAVLIQTSLSGQLHVLSKRTKWRVVLAYPLLPLLVLARIHWQAVRLWLKGVPFFRKPPPPTVFVTR